MGRYIVLEEDDVDVSTFTDIDEYSTYEELLLDTCDYLEQFESLEYAFERYPKMVGFNARSEGKYGDPADFSQERAQTLRGDIAEDVADLAMYNGSPDAKVGLLNAFVVTENVLTKTFGARLEHEDRFREEHPEAWGKLVDYVPSDDLYHNYSTVDFDRFIEHEMTFYRATVAEMVDLVARDGVDAIDRMLADVEDYEKYIVDLNEETDSDFNHWDLKKKIDNVRAVRDGREPPHDIHIRGYA